MFKSQCCYESSLRQRFEELPKTVADLINVLLSVEPENRLTARSALQAEYFYTKPYQCDPSSMPTYPPNKEIDAKFREATRRKLGRACEGSRNTRKVNSYKPVVEDMYSYFLGSRDTVNSEIVTPPARASFSRFMWEKRRKEHLQRHQRLMQPDYLNSSHVYKPKVLSYDHQERDISGHTILLDQLGSADVRQLEYYIRSGVHRSHSSNSKDVAAHERGGVGLMVKCKDEIYDSRFHLVVEAVNGGVWQWQRLSVVEDGVGDEGGGETRAFKISGIRN
ncbi:uncharacterized protein LOC143618008 [Bidens hawaiensis]|uniref:uncharacterized protein LOC143618008 n=1 Tax=Bidens hawaiensis TaxID=980011 RepID=UPI004049D984